MWNERYVDAAADGLGDGTTTATSGATGAWTFAQYVATAAGGQRVNVKAGTYARTTNTDAPAGGSHASPIWVRGYNTTPGDLDSAHALALPAVTYTTGSLTPGGHTWQTSLNITGATTPTAVVVTGSFGRLDRCRVENTSNGLTVNAGAAGSQVTRCWLKAAATVAPVLTLAHSATAHGNRIVGGGYSISLVSTGGVAVITANVLSGMAINGIYCNSLTFSFQIIGNTLYGAGASSSGIHIDLIDPANPSAIVNNIFDTWAAYGIKNDTGGSANAIYRAGNDFHACTTANEFGLGDTPSLAEQADSASPFTNAGTGDFTLAATSNARQHAVPGAFENATLTSYASIGAVQELGGSAGGIITTRRPRPVIVRRSTRSRRCVVMPVPNQTLIHRPRGPVLVRPVYVARHVHPIPVTIRPILSVRRKSWVNRFTRVRRPIAQPAPNIAVVRRPRGPVLVRPVTRQIRPSVNMTVASIVAVRRHKAWKGLFLRTRSPVVQSVTLDVHPQGRPRRGTVVRHPVARVRRSVVTVTAVTVSPVVHRPRGPVRPPARHEKPRRSVIAVAVTTTVTVHRDRRVTVKPSRIRRAVVLPAPSVCTIVRPRGPTITPRFVRRRRPFVSAVVSQPVLVRRRVSVECRLTRTRRVHVTGPAPLYPVIHRPRGPVIVARTQVARRVHVNCPPATVIIRRPKGPTVVVTVGGPTRRAVQVTTRVSVHTRRAPAVVVRPVHAVRRAFVFPAPPGPVFVRRRVQVVTVSRRAPRVSVVILPPGVSVQVRRKRPLGGPWVKMMRRTAVTVTAPPTTLGPIIARRRTVR